MRVKRGIRNAGKVWQPRTSRLSDHLGFVDSFFNVADCAFDTDPHIFAVAIVFGAIRELLIRTRRNIDAPGIVSVAMGTEKPASRIVTPRASLKLKIISRLIAVAVLAGAGFVIYHDAIHGRWFRLTILLCVTLVATWHTMRPKRSSES